MENKELQQPIPEALKDEQLEAVAGGVDMTDSSPGMALPYYALGIMYQRTTIQQQMEEVDKLKEEERLRDAMNTRQYDAINELNAKLAEMNAMSIVHQTGTERSAPSLPLAELSGTL